MAHQDNTTRRGLVLRIHGESFLPWPPEFLPKSQTGPYVGLLLTEYVPLAQIAMRSANTSHGYSIIDTPDYEIVGAEFDLETFVSDKTPNNEHDIYRQNMYIVRNDTGLITDVITCNKIGSVPFPGC